MIKQADYIGSSNTTTANSLGKTLEKTTSL